LISFPGALRKRLEVEAENVAVDILSIIREEVE